MSEQRSSAEIAHKINEQAHCHGSESHRQSPRGSRSRKQPPTSVISTKYYSLRGSPYLITGYVFRF